MRKLGFMVSSVLGQGHLNWLWAPGQSSVVDLLPAQLITDIFFLFQMVFLGAKKTPLIIIALEIFICMCAHVGALVHAVCACVGVGVCVCVSALL